LSTNIYKSVHTVCRYGTGTYIFHPGDQKYTPLATWSGMKIIRTSFTYAGVFCCGHGVVNPWVDEPNIHHIVYCIYSLKVPT